MLKQLMIFMFLVKLSIPTLDGSCNRCFPSNDVACVDETHFATCFKSSPTPTITTCPHDHFCTDNELICRSSAEHFKPACYHNDYCGECDITNGIFTCLNETTYGYCFGGKTPVENTIRSCPQGYVCNYNSIQVCVPETTNEPSCGSKNSNTTQISTIPTESKIEVTTFMTKTTKVLAVVYRNTTTTEMTSKSAIEIPTTKTTTITQNIETVNETSTETKTTTSNSKTYNADIFCRELAANEGYIESDDPTCQKFVYCYILSGQLLGVFYYCEGYFNVATQKCQKERPPNCVAH